MATFEIFRDLTICYRFALKNDIGDIVLYGLGHSMRERVLKDIESVRQSAGNDDRYERKLELDICSFVLKGSTGDVIGKSELFATALACEQAVLMVKKAASLAQVLELE